MIWRMALRNLRRNTRRTLITLASIGFGLLLSLTFTGVGDSGYKKLIEGAARLGSGLVTVMPAGYLDTPSLEKSVTDVSRLIPAIKAVPHVTRVVERIVGQAMVATAGESTGAAFMAIDPDAEDADTVYMLTFIKKGALFAKDDNRGVVVGQKMADRLNIRIGSKMVITVTDRHGEIISALARVRGIFDSGSDSVDGYFILLPIDATRKLLGYAPDEATEIAVFLDDHRKTSRVIDTIAGQPAFRGLDVLSWRKTMEEMSGFIAMDQSVNYLFQIIIFLLVAAGILNTILMSVLERYREFGIMMAIGLTPGRLFRLVLAEAVWLGIFGIITGLIITAPAYGYLHFHGWDFSGLIHEKADVAGVVFDTTIYNDLRWEHLLIILTGAFLITLLSGLYPAWKAGRVVPVETIKNM